MATTLNKELLTAEVQHYLRINETADAARIALQKSPFPGIEPAVLAQQLDGRQRCRLKLPLWYDTPGIYYPPRISVEQASSAQAAAYKSKLVAAGSRVIDLTGGYGVDSYYLSQRATTLTYCEQQPALAAIAAHNFATLGAQNITVQATDGLTFLADQPNDTFDCIYLDPSRRKGRQKVFLLSDCEPDIAGIQQMLLEKAASVYVKVAPLLDISAVLRHLRQISHIHVISVDNECKELLLVLNRTHYGLPQLSATALNRHGREQTFRFTQAEEQAAVPTLGLPEAGDYLYEPDAALLKAGAFKCIGQRYNVAKLHLHTHLYTSARSQPGFIGRAFRVIQLMSYTVFKKSYSGIQANTSTRNFPLDAAALRKKHRIQDGGDLFLFFCTGPTDELTVIFASKS